MNLDMSQISAVTIGAARVEEDQNGFNFYRFTKGQEELYKARSSDFYDKTFATSGIRLSFSTDSETLFLKTAVSRGSSRKYFAFSLFVNGKKLDTLDNFSGEKLPVDYTKAELSLGEFSKRFCLGVGKKDVCLYFPWSVRAIIKELALDDGSYIEPIRPGKKLICFGDSITQGYDALYPHNKYTSQLADALGAEEHNKAIGGEIFFPGLAAEKEAFEPDCITVAYGTNDWSRCTREEFTENCKEFFYNLNRSYPETKIFAITPIWRKGMMENTPFGEFKDVGELIHSIAGAYDNLSVIRGFEFVPQNEELFADLSLHPNDRGFGYYATNLINQIKERLPL